MAKAKVSSPVFDMWVEKPYMLENGTMYRVMSEYRISEHGNVVPEGYFLKECSDGWWQVLDRRGDKHYFRVGPELLKKINTLLINVEAEKKK